MKQYTPQEILTLAKASSSHRETLFQFFQVQARFHAAHIDAQPTAEHYAEVIVFYEEIAEIRFTPEQVRTIVQMSPTFRIKLAVYNGLHDTEVRDLAAEALAAFFLHTRWPMFGGRLLGLTEFIGLLKEQAGALGYQVLSPA